jgi:hypothetical protein
MNGGRSPVGQQNLSRRGCSSYNFFALSASSIPVNISCKRCAQSVLGRAYLAWEDQNSPIASPDLTTLAAVDELHSLNELKSLKETH